MKRKLALVIVLLLTVSPYLLSTRSDAAEKYAVKINVTDKEYGAKADTDSTNAIQKALNNAAKTATSKKRALVTIPKGTYLISSSLSIGSNTHLKCAKGTVIKKVSNTCLYMLRSIPGTKGGYKDAVNITVEGGTFDANFIEYNDNSGGTLLFFSHTNKLKILNVTLKNNLGTHLIELAGVNNAEISKCKLYGFKYGSSGSEKEAIQLDITHNDTISPSAAPYDDTACSNVTVKNNEIHDYPRAIGSHSAVKGIYHNKITIENNNIHDISGTAVYAYNYTNFTVTDNTITNVGTGIAAKTFAASAPKTLYDRNPGVKAAKFKNNDFNTNISGNTITTVTGKEDEDDGGGMGIFIYGTAEYPISGCKITDNKLTTLSSGVYLRFISKTTVSKNTMIRPVKAFNTNDTSFAEDAVKLLNSSGCIISDNTISDSGTSFENGIALRDSSIDNSISNNTLMYPDKSGIALYDSSSAKASSNIITGAGKHGVTAVTDCTLTMTANKITKGAENGITILSSTADIRENNIVSENNGHGISITKESTVTIDNNRIEKNKENGITVITSNVDIINQNSIIENKLKGISITNGSTVNVSDNMVCDNTDTGILIGSSKIGRFTDNIITGNIEKGISLSSCKSGQIMGNKLCNPTAKWELTLASCSLKPLENTYSILLTAPVAGDTVITGTANKAVTLSLSVNDDTYTILSNKRTFTFNVPSLQSGDKVSVSLIDANKNEYYTESTVK